MPSGVRLLLTAQTTRELGRLPGSLARRLAACCPLLGALFLGPLLRASPGGPLGFSLPPVRTASSYPLDCPYPLGCKTETRVCGLVVLQN